MLEKRASGFLDGLIPTLLLAKKKWSSCGDPIIGWNMARFKMDMM